MNKIQQDNKYITKGKGEGGGGVSHKPHPLVRRSPGGSVPLTYQFSTPTNVQDVNPTWTPNGHTWHPLFIKLDHKY